MGTDLATFMDTCQFSFPRIFFFFFWCVWPCLKACEIHILQCAPLFGGRGDWAGEASGLIQAWQAVTSLPVNPDQSGSSSCSFLLSWKCDCTLRPWPLTSQEDPPRSSLQGPLSREAQAWCYSALAGPGFPARGIETERRQVVVI